MPNRKNIQHEERPRLHVQTLAELNYCVGTARRDAAYHCLCNICLRENWPESCQERALLYTRCITLIQASLDAAERTGLCRTNPRQALADKPLQHFLNLIQQQLLTLHFIAEHTRNVSEEAEVLEEHLGEELFRRLEEACLSFGSHEMASIQALAGTLEIGRELLESNSSRRKGSFSAEDLRRYDKAYSEFLEYYSGANE